MKANARSAILERIEAVLPHPGLRPTPEAEERRKAIAADIRQDLQCHGGISIYVRIRDRLKPDALQAQIERALSRSGIPVRPQDTSEGPALLLSLETRPYGRLMAYTLSLDVLQAVVKPTPEGKLIIQCARTWGVCLPGVTDTNGIPARLSADARILIRRLTADLSSDSRKVRSDAHHSPVARIGGHFQHE